MKSKSIFPYPLAVLAICLWLILLNVPLALAQGNYVPLAPIDVEGSEFTSPSYTYPGDTRADRTCAAPTCFPRYLRTIYNIGIALAGFFAVFSIVRGGFELLFTDSILGHTEAKGIILRAIGGLIVVYSSYILMNTINPQLARDLSLNFETLPPPKAAFGDLPPPLTEKAREQILQEAKTKQAQKAALESIELDALAADYRKSAAAARANNDEESAQTYAALANDIEVESFRLHAGKLINTDYSRGLAAAQTPDGGENARLWIQNINSIAASNITEFIKRGDIVDAATLYEQQLRSTATIAQEISYQQVNKNQATSVISTLNSIKNGTSSIINKLEALKQGASATDIAHINSRIDCVKRNGSDIIGNIISRCKEGIKGDFLLNQCNSYQNPFPKPACTPGQL